MKESTTLGDIEAQLWKKNITFENRSNKDYLDVSKEDFSKNKTISIEGKEITPSSKSNYIIYQHLITLLSQISIYSETV